MLKCRVIPTLLWKNVGLVKGKAFDSWRRVGTVLPAIKVYNTREVDELIILDITATNDDCEPDYFEVELFSKECFVPLTVGGGIKTLSHIEKLLSVGADKICVNTHAILEPDFVTQAAQRFGSQCIVASVDFKRLGDQIIVFSHSGRVPEDLDIFDWAKDLEQRGAGEILLTSIDRDGMMCGYDLDMIHQIAHAVSIPVIASGGASNYSDMLNAKKAGADAVAAASIFHFTEQTPKEAKIYLAEQGVPVRNSQLLEDGGEA